MGIAAGIVHFFQSILEVIQGILSAILGFFQGILQLLVGFFNTILDTAEGLVGFTFRNFFVLGTIAAAIFGYVLYVQRTGKDPVGSTINSKKRA